jgi:hypothetical protein
MDSHIKHNTAHCYTRAPLIRGFHGMVYFQDPVENVRNPLDI